MELSGCYAEASLVDGDYRRHAGYVGEVIAAAGKWKGCGACPKVVEQWWSDLLLQHGDAPVADIGVTEGSFSPIVSLLMRLLATADEASAGVGWVPREDDLSDVSAIKKRVAANFLHGVDPSAAALPHVPASLCEMVPPDKATVLPKSLTPSLGCTIRSMSHHLALLPAKSVVESQWVLPDNGLTSDDTMRLLVIPYPFRVDDESFVSSGPNRELGNGAKIQPYFALDPTWLKAPTVTATMLRDELIAPLIEAAEKKFGRGAVDGVLFPECALTADLADQLLELLAQEPITGLKFLITGTIAAGIPGTDSSDGQPGRNLAKTMLFDDGAASADDRIVWDDAHSKHHRWALNTTQISRYGLTGISVRNKAKVWEHIAVGQRKLPFLALRDDLCMTVLICEDLARADPAMPVIRSVGPNLVVALLMDGPQLASRWPGRYATVLAEDPGSSVLSITSAGMVDRSNLGERAPARAIGLWRHEQGYNTELYLPLGHHGLLLTVKAKEDEQFSLDHRTDQMATRCWTLETVTPLAAAADWF
ncbi:hypothetical protein Q3O98_25140 [Ralstonia pseudosolanacearum]|uniref:hypothetical protein n=1 Tax=Ralstonia pseudosolanacearum TaxID=1310165 RepID=UPI002674C2B6|nr:hypothetical protein [Ralstonia pseudosolanacearum]MDO3624363.1 hypothetical protein [Ralstonia pseudosolanacearum]